MVNYLINETSLKKLWPNEDQFFRELRVQERVGIVAMLIEEMNFLKRLSLKFHKYDRINYLI